ncbi:aminoglycoside phosphotransferase family protein [Microlunatus soli]|uniref:Predicted kinase, aminoglycoside phosphotransferase (APT) family n=1 Tax=Microlunatus soli TaxID=630515 RepID=A0A1H1UZY8_9ACTN|nr:aminoglycoside phosphotransferase family protein [Microlunatus soli]SDS78025.1 Predicted kinase, aminoglycoside phosphotransferase (APT) family [Microlunatus soli]
MTMHADQLHVDPGIVRGLLDAQFPQWRGLPISQLETPGTVNAIFRVGTDLAARFPLVGDDPAQTRTILMSEADASLELAPAIGVPIPEPVVIGEPGPDYPLPWAVQTWLSGHDATVEDPAESDAFADDLVELIAGMRALDTRGRRFAGIGRGGHLPNHDDWLEVCFDNSEELLDVPLLRRIWADLRALPEVDADAMCHRDLIPPNLLIDNGRLVGVLDCGGFGPADPALDLVAAWHLLAAPQREILRRGLGSGDLQWRRGMEWAFQQAMGLVWYYLESNPTMSRWGRRTLDRIVEAWDDHE